MKGPNGLRPVITDAALARVAQIAPNVAQLLPQSESEQRQAILQPPAAVSQTASPEISAPAESGQENVLQRTSTPETGAIEQQPTYQVHVQNAAGETSTVEIKAESAEAAQAQVAAKIPAGQGLIRGVEEIPASPALAASVQGSGVQGSEGGSNRINFRDLRPGELRDRVLAQVATEANRGLTEKETRRVDGLLERFLPAAERWQRAFDGLQVTARRNDSMGALLKTGDLTLSLSLPDIARHAQEFSNPEGAELVVRHEAIHAVAVALAKEGKIDPEGTYLKLPEEAKRYEIGRAHV